MTEYYDESYFCIFNDPVVFAQHCGNPVGGMIDLAPPPAYVPVEIVSPRAPFNPPFHPHTPAVPEPATYVMMMMGILVVCLFRFIKR